MLSLLTASNPAKITFSVGIEEIQVQLNPRLNQLNKNFVYDPLDKEKMNINRAIQIIIKKNFKNVLLE